MQGYDYRNTLYDSGAVAAGILEEEMVRGNVFLTVALIQYLICTF